MIQETFWSHWAWPLATALLGLAFALLVLRQWGLRRRAHQLAWGVGLLFYSVAAFLESYSELTGSWNPGVYRVYVVLAASLVGLLGLGTLYLLVHARAWGHAYLAFNVACFALFAWGAARADLLPEKLVPGITVGGQALGPSGSFPRVMSLFFNIPGTILLLGGAILSAWRFSRRAEFAYRMWANVLIAAGTLVIGFVGARARLGNSAGLYPAEMAASALLLWGFLLAGTLDQGARAAAHRRERAP